MTKNPFLTVFFLSDWNIHFKGLGLPERLSAAEVQKKEIAFTWHRFDGNPRRSPVLLLLCGSLSGRDFLLYKRAQNFSWETSLNRIFLALLQQHYTGSYICVPGGWARRGRASSPNYIRTFPYSTNFPSPPKDPKTRPFQPHSTPTPPQSFYLVTSEPPSLIVQGWVIFS